MFALLFYNPTRSFFISYDYKLRYKNIMEIRIKVMRGASHARIIDSSRIFYIKHIFNKVVIVKHC